MLPDGVVIKKQHYPRATEGVPAGAGRPVRPDPESREYMAICETAREQGVKRGCGRPPIFRDATELEHACQEYFLWVDDNPFYEEIPRYSEKRDKWVVHKKPKPRPYTQGALCLYLGIPQDTWIDWRKNREEYREVIANVEHSIRQQKFAGAAAGFFNANIIARDLGMVDKQEVTNPTAGVVEKITENMTPEEAADYYAKTRENG